MFMNTLCVKEWSVRNWAMSGSTSHGMQESSHHTPPKAADDPKSELARSFLESLPKLPSHYCRRDSNKLYLETTVQSKSQLVKLFQAYCESKGVKRASRQVLIRVSKQMNIAIFKPRKDQCNICTSYILGLYSAEQFDCHIRRKEEAPNEKKKDKRMAQDDSSVLVLTMDLLAVLLAPRLFASASYFKTKLCCHNFTLYELTSRTCVCYFGMNAMVTSRAILLPPALWTTFRTRSPVTHSVPLSSTRMGVAIKIEIQFCQTVSCTLQWKTRQLSYKSTWKKGTPGWRLIRYTPPLNADYVIARSTGHLSIQRSSLLPGASLILT